MSKRPSANHLGLQSCRKKRDLKWDSTSQSGEAMEIEVGRDFAPLSKV